MKMVYFGTFLCKTRVTVACKTAKLSKFAWCSSHGECICTSCTHLRSGLEKPRFL